MEAMSSGMHPHCKQWLKKKSCYSVVGDINKKRQR